ncbi:putative sentrin-specific protease 6-like isoform X1 [Penaeus vannamei]|uniref:Putative sentrin-specific protease 6-like isoform X1 n=1 Tax=Penaeus vannamei TaxID=6689 RepID=A0A423TNB3_PENVA|nr:putative sentrin-specific protease 6-like isoform X1 [Penaeus vannamei]
MQAPPPNLPRGPKMSEETKALKGGISITTDDYCCLEEEQFLNDVIIDFYLKWLLQSKLPEIHRSHTHVFSTFFYKRLTSKPKRGRRPHTTEDDPKLSPAEKRHARVKSWTKNVDIFEKDFIIIPINEHAHWFLAIICFPGLDSPIRICDGQPVARPISEKPKRRRSTRPKNRIEQIPIIDDGEWSDRDEAEGEEDELEEEEEEEDVPATKKNKLEAGKAEEAQGPKEAATPPPAIKQPCILIFDSLTGANRSRIVATLRDYLAVEHKIRRGSEKLFNRDTMKGACPRVPQQMNYSDCGIYTLQFAESFFEHPLKDYTFPIRSLTEWFPHEVVRGKREAMAKLIRNLMEQHNPNHSSITLPDIYFSSDDKKDKGGTSTAHASDASQPQKEVSGQGKPGDSKTPEVQLKKEQERVIIKDGVLTQVEGSGREQNHRMDMSSSAEVVTSLPNSDNTACIKVNRVTPSKITPTKSPTVNPAMSKSSSSYTPVKTLPNSSNIITSQVNSVKFQGTTYSQAKAIPSSRVGDATIVHETQSPQVNNVRRQMVYSSDDAIFPVKVDQKKVPMRENNAAQLSETHQGTEVSSKKIESVMTGSLGVDKVGNPVKAVESSGQTAIIDEDTAEVLLIMPAKNQTSGQIPRTAKKQLENSSPEDDSIMIEEGPGFGGYVTADRRPMKNSLSSGMPKMGAVGGGHERGDIRRSGGVFGTSPPHSGSSSPTHAGGTGTPAVFRFSERGTSSGRTIAPPKRYLDEDEELYPKKRRDKTVQGKARSIVR